MITIAIQKDRQRLTSGRTQSFSTRWIEQASIFGFEVCQVDAYAPDFFDRLAGCDGFMWWFAQPMQVNEPGRRIVSALRHSRPALTVFPSWETIWHFDDKVAQAYLLESAGLPTPKTWVFWSPEQATNFLAPAEYPLVLKLPGGIVSRNVALLHNPRESDRWITRLFGRGTYGLGASGAMSGNRLRQMWRGPRATVRRLLFGPRTGEKLYRGNMLIQEFLPGNTHDTRVTVIGRRAFAFRRHNRPGDFRASGSGRIDWTPSEIAEDAIRLAFRTAQFLRTQSLAVDVLRCEGKPVIGEISYYYEGWAVAQCPGHWVEAEDGGLVWVEGPMSPEDAILEDFLAAVRADKDHLSLIETRDNS